MIVVKRNGTNENVHSYAISDRKTKTFDRTSSVEPTFLCTQTKKCDHQPQIQCKPAMDRKTFV